MTTEVISTHTPALFAEAVAAAAAALQRGEVVALPTETVYGLAANAMDPAAVARIYAVKGRPADNPVIVHVASRAMARACSSAWPELAERLAIAFWPGPLTLVVPRGPDIPDGVTAGGSTVAVRWPIHPLMPAVIRATGFPLAAPSANLANRLSPTSAAHVIDQLGGRIPLVVDGGDCNVGIESTVVDCTGPEPVILRPGMISAAAISAATSSPFRAPSGRSEGGDGRLPGVDDDEAAPRRSPGQLRRHYSPRAPLRVWTWVDDADLERQLDAAGARRETTYVLVHSRVPHGLPPEHVILFPDDPEAYARALYAELHRCDAAGASWIVVEALPEGDAWAGLADRLRRAATE